MTIKDNLYFVYNNKYSQDLAISNVSVQPGLYEESFLPSSEIREIQVRGRTKRFFQEIVRNPLVLNLSFAFNETWNEPLIREVAKLFLVDYYKPLWFSNNDDRIFYCLYEGDFPLLHNGLRQGYVSLAMRCDDAYAYSKVRQKTHNIISSPQIVEFLNVGDIAIKPELIIKMITIEETEDITIANNTTGESFTLTGIVNNEEVYINFENEVIQSSLEVYRYDNFSGDYLEMDIGKNMLEVTTNGEVELRWRWRFRMLQGDWILDS